MIEDRRSADELLAGALKGAFAKEVAALVVAMIQEIGIPQKKLLAPAEAAWSLGVTESAFNQAPWKNEIRVTKLGIQNRYRPENLDIFIQNHGMEPLRKLPSRSRAA